MNDDERIEFLYHGTSLGTAQSVRSTRKFAEQITFFTTDKPLAWHFAARSCMKSRRAESPALLVNQVYLEDLHSWKQRRLVQNLPFDEADAPELRGKTQLKFAAEAVRLLNVYALEWLVEGEFSASRLTRL
ncbi:hypothetical protein [Burkholderia sp. Ac-20365]|uniref:hypothetical protein n=1 Tax=Burkholderia sp. Ac-20365 TaxID=2703897 RepID=UPI00197B48EC|nr:hypothetical protein [Burkholderia sp. Ac-20365]MBN3760730.1 hypothetical protein [Burkholderia sp. Ac-20365]